MEDAVVDAAVVGALEKLPTEGSLEANFFRRISPNMVSMLGRLVDSMVGFLNGVTENKLCEHNRLLTEGTEMLDGVLLAE